MIAELYTLRNGDCVRDTKDAGDEGNNKKQ